MRLADYKHLVIGLIFVKCISDTFSATRAELMLRLEDLGDDDYYGLRRGARRRHRG